MLNSIHVLFYFKDASTAVISNVRTWVAALPEPFDMNKVLHFTSLLSIVLSVFIIT